MKEQRCKSKSSLFVKFFLKPELPSDTLKQSARRNKSQLNIQNTVPKAIFTHGSKYNTAYNPRMHSVFERQKIDLILVEAAHINSDRGTCCKSAEESLSPREVGEDLTAEEPTK